MLDILDRANNPKSQVWSFKTCGLQEEWQTRGWSCRPEQIEEFCVHLSQVTGDSSQGCAHRSRWRQLQEERAKKKIKISNKGWDWQDREDVQAVERRKRPRGKERCIVSTPRLLWNIAGRTHRLVRRMTEELKRLIAEWPLAPEGQFNTNSPFPTHKEQNPSTSRLFSHTCPPLTSAFIF